MIWVHMLSWGITLMNKEKTQQLHNENLAFRYLYALGVIFVVLSHVGGGLEMGSNVFHFGAFHLAIFLFGSGYFWKEDKIDHPDRTVMNWLRKLILPLWVTNAIYGIALLGLAFFGIKFTQVDITKFLVGPIFDTEMFDLNLGAWFVFPFFLTQFLYWMVLVLAKRILTAIQKETSYDSICIVWQVLFMLIGFAGVFFATRRAYPLPLGVIIRVCYFAPFFVLGIWYKRWFETWVCKVPRGIWMLVCVVIGMAMQTYYGRLVFVIPSSCDYPFGVVATYASAIIAILFWMMICYYLADIKQPVTALVTVGQHTWDIMFHQFFGFFVVNTVFAILHQCGGLFTMFDMGAYMSDVWYQYMPAGLEVYKLAYVMSGIVIPIGIGNLMKKVQGRRQ